MTLANFPKTWRMPATQHEALFHVVNWQERMPVEVGEVVGSSFYENIRDYQGELAPVDLEPALVEVEAHIDGYRIEAGKLYAIVNLDACVPTDKEVLIELLAI